MNRTVTHYRIHGMDCAEETAALRREVGPVAGGEANLSFDLLRGRMTVTAEGSVIPVDSILDAVRRAGMRAEEWREEADQSSGNLSKNGRAVALGVSGMFLATGFVIHAVMGGLPAWAAYGLSSLSGAWYILPKAWSALRRLRPDMNLLMTIAVIGAMSIGEWLEAAMVSFLFALSLLLESWSVGRARRAVEKLMESAPDTVRLVEQGGVERDVPPEQVHPGAEFIVLPGEKIPLDGLVIRGESEVNQAPITGESMPVEKTTGSEVFAGCINGNGSLVIRSTKTADSTTLANIIRLVTEAQSRRAPSEQWVEKFARVYTPIVMIAAVLTCVAPPLLFGAGWDDWIYRSLVLLVIACPCALVISTPVSIVAALTAASRMGVLVKGGAYMEAPAHIKAVAMDKTGTLTEGHPVVTRLVPLGEHDEIELLTRAAALESRSDHPLAKAIVSEAERREATFSPARDVQVIPGKGVTGWMDGKSYWIGSHSYLEECDRETPALHEMLSAMSNEGSTTVVVGTDGHVCGVICLADAIRPEAARAVHEMRNQGVERIVMLTGDNARTAEAVALETGVDEVRADLLPEDKVDAVEDLVRRYGRVAMVGDGINDAPAMGRATIGIAMGAAGSDVAVETADVALMSDDLSRVPWLMAQARRTLGIIRWNIGLALSVKLLFVILTMAGHASLWAAIAADTGASLLVTFNGLRLLKGGSESNKVPHGTRKHQEVF